MLIHDMISDSTALLVLFCNCNLFQCLSVQMKPLINASSKSIRTLQQNIQVWFTLIESPK